MKRNKRKTKLKPILIVTLLIIVTILGGILLYGQKLYNKLNRVDLDQSQLGISDSTKEELSQYNNKDNITNIALFGIDGKDTNSGRSDSIMILTIDSAHKSIKISSIMRDSYVNIPGKHMDKINHAFAFGKAPLALQTINENFGLDIDKYIATDFSNLPKIVDSLGGVDISITSEEVSHIPGISSPGEHTLNGSQALAYSRIRYASGGDYQRTARQRTILNAIYKKTLGVSPSEYPKLLNEYLPFIETNMSIGNLLDLGGKIASIGSPSIIENRFPQDGYCEGKMINGIYYLTFDINTTKEQIRDFIYNK